MLRLYIHSKQVAVSAGVDIKPGEWDPSREMVRKSNSRHKELNMIVQRAKSRANDIMIKYQLMERPITADLFRKEFTNPVNYNDFPGWMLGQINTRLENEEIEKSTAKIHKTAVNYLVEFKGIQTFADLTKKNMDELESFCLKKKKISINTTSKLLRALKTYINIAIGEELIDKNPFSQKTIKKGETRMVYLEREEVEVLVKRYKSKQLQPHQQKALRNWLFAFFQCGLRRSDFKRLRFEYIHNDTILFAPFKTRRFEKNIVMPLTRNAKRMIKAHNKNGVQGLIFDTFSDQAENRYLKEAAIMCGINKEISFHVARHTFATLFLEETDDLATLQKLLGHSKITETMVYAHVTERKKREQIKRFDAHIPF